MRDENDDWLRQRSQGKLPSPEYYEAMIRKLVEAAPPIDEERAKRIGALLSGSARDTLETRR